MELCTPKLKKTRGTEIPSLKLIKTKSFLYFSKKRSPHMSGGLLI